VTRVLERTEGFRQLLGNILTVNAALVAQRQNDKLTRLSEAGYDQNEQVKRISSWAAILFAPTVIASIYGMNFTHIPELEWQLGVDRHRGCRPGARFPPLTVTTGVSPPWRSSAPPPWRSTGLSQGRAQQLLAEGRQRAEPSPPERRGRPGAPPQGATHTS
jgi:hypothetical protein